MADETPNKVPKKKDFEVIIKLRQAHWGGNGLEPDHRLDVYSVWIKGHSICPPGKPYRVGYTGSEKVVDEDGVQTHGNLCFLFDPSGEYSGPSKKLHKSDLAKIRDAVVTWQGDAVAVAKSREDAEVTL